ncbi:MAG: cupin domain-containing protein [Armatimonadetes bacterium]|nr:cupin domain-containing protein [Armatimonadota bacterium]
MAGNGHAGKSIEPGEVAPLNVMGLDIRILLSGEDTGGAYTLTEMTAKPGESTPVHIHGQEDECLRILEGQWEVKVDDDVFAAGPGTCVFIPQGAVDTATCVGDGPGRAQVIYTPAGIETFFRGVDELCRHGMPPEADLMALAMRQRLEILAPPSQMAHAAD